MHDVETGQLREAGFHKGGLVFGRDRPERASEVDFLLRVWPYDNERNCQLTKTISGRQFELYPSGGRLVLRDLSSYGTSVNGRSVGRDLTRSLRDGDVISPFSRPEEVMHRSWRVFLHGTDEVERVELRRNW